ncbi:class I SAM-dependent methyltransferase [Usitatibacter palustris]|uniref:2-methoxy-6-polyprenyl-1,4-benzoquinol methylase, mitochondrial n=1 Tax=Usitatibacter palustris TaxID=2732487 RepID=A0A6M4HCN7_9PROT|nr:class I SAM-dependent methyltransferase [Usitatibacter palustris]QJR16498.1 2-methoxy-6-polyprenyl-1,4-benzoquinol methylase, mitochondrial [Usitatibacter palustris]
MSLRSEVLETLVCPVTREALTWSDEWVANSSRSHRYRISESGIPLFAEEFCSAEGRIQQHHYDKVAAAYMESLAYPHTLAYTEALDDAFLALMEKGGMGRVAEICCGRGEAFRLLRERVGAGVGVDVSISMLEAARRELGGERIAFVQGDATALPIADGAYDNVVMFGGIHHVNDREKLFSEVFRILKPGGRFYWREPVSDFFLWRLLRAIIYRLSPALDHETERPLLYRETVPVLEKVGFELRRWETYGFLGFCFFMNSDVLVFNRAFRFIPGIRAITRGFARLDELTLKLPGMSRAGLQVLGVAQKPASGTP